MLQHTFQHLRGFSERRERELWQTHTYTLTSFREQAPTQRQLFADDDDSTKGASNELDASIRALAASDVDFFVERLARREHFRLALAFPSDTIFLDIETTGLSRVYNHITVVGWFLNNEYGFFVRGQSIAPLEKALKRAKVIVTFNGSLFDIPFIRHEIPQVHVPAAHVDLRFLARRIGLSGGQKLIEQQLELARDSSVSSMTGEFAPVLWADYKRGDIDALRRLLRYNAADILGMRKIFDHTVKALATNAGLPRKLVSSFPRFSPKKLSVDRQLIESTVETQLHPWEKPATPVLALIHLLAECGKRPLVAVGIDLTGSESKASGWCVLRDDAVETALIYSDDDLVRRTIAVSPTVVSIDSPLTLPDGRISVFDDDPGRVEFGIMRFCERELKRRGVNVYPALIPSMQRLTRRGIQLATRLRSLGIPVIESYPGAAQDIMGIVRKRKGLEHLAKGLSEFGIRGIPPVDHISHDELDAITSAVVGAFFWSGRVERLGVDPIGEEALFIPQVNSTQPFDNIGQVIGISGALGAGKTTAARFFERKDFKYCRYSEVIEALVRRTHSDVSRRLLQEEGQRVHVELGQRWLGRALIRNHLSSAKLVIDGLRFPDDHAFLVEIFGWKFDHLHVNVSRNIRKARYEARESADFDLASGHQVESQAQTLEQLASIVVDNDSTLISYESQLANLLSTRF
jgi:uncharacterized protein YprB with RNaseH-like and TPR domain/predicted nuclease with RNAse H fold/dephospho-CoA kinase